MKTRFETEAQANIAYLDFGRWSLRDSERIDSAHIFFTLLVYLDFYDQLVNKGGGGR